MKILLDHCVPRPFERQLAGHEATHTSRLGWGRLDNGGLLSAAENAGYQVLITVDRNMQFQQSMSGRQISVISLRVPKNDLASLTPMANLILARLDRLEPGSVVTVQHPDWK